MTSDEWKMPNPVEVMLARWPLLYPEVAGADEENDNDEAIRVQEEVVRPLLDTEDFLNTFEGRLEAYKRWKMSLPGTEPGLDAVITPENQKDDALAATFEGHRDVLGEQAVRGTRETVNLRRIVRESVIPYRETWPEESWERIAHLMTGSVLRQAGILEFLATGQGSRDNVETLARWGFENALEAYWEPDDMGSTPRNWRTSRSERQTADTGRDLMTVACRRSPSRPCRVKGALIQQHPWEENDGDPDPGSHQGQRNKEQGGVRDRRRHHHPERLHRKGRPGEGAAGEGQGRDLGGVTPATCNPSIPMKVNHGVFHWKWGPTVCPGSKARTWRRGPSPLAACNATILGLRNGQSVEHALPSRRQEQIP